MKTAWILNHYAQEPGGPGGTRHYSLALHMPDFGWQAVIMAASAEMNTSRQRLYPKETKRISPITKSSSHKGSILWIRTPAHAGNGMDRIANILSYTIGAILPSTTRLLPTPNVIIGSSVHPLAAVAGLLLARRSRVPFIFEVRDLWPQTLIDLGRLKPGSLVTSLLRYMEKMLYHNADRIIVLLPDASKYITALGIPLSRIAWIPNGVDIKSYPPPPISQINKSFTYMYFGAHGNANGLDNILEALYRVQNKAPDLPIYVRLIGDGPQKAKLKAQAKNLGLRRVSFESSVPKARIPRLAAEADAFIFNLVDAPVFRYGISSNKLFDFLAGNRPILFCSNANNNPVQEVGAGYTVEPGNPSKLCDAMIRLYNTPIEMRRAMGRAGRKYVEDNHDYRLLTDKLVTLLDEISTS